MKTPSLQTILATLAINCLVVSRTNADTFGSGVNTFTIDFVTIGNPGNPDDRAYDNSNDTPGVPNDDDYASPYGGVSYVYRMGVTEVPQTWMDAATALGMTNVTSGPWTGLQPAAFTSWYEAAAFVNWLNTSTGHQAAYDLTWTGSAWSMNLWNSAVAWDNDAGAGVELNLYRHKDAYYFLPSDDEWYKAGFHQNDGATANYWDYATGSNDVPTAVVSGTDAGTAVFDAITSAPAAVDDNGGLSPYGTRGQNGNMWEWLESAFMTPNDSPSEIRAIRGGFWSTAEDTLRSSDRGNGGPGDSTSDAFGFRVASVPEPSAGMLILGSGLALLLQRRHRL